MKGNNSTRVNMETHKFYAHPLFFPVRTLPRYVSAVCYTFLNSPEVALDLVLDVARAGRSKKKGIGKIWRFENNASAAEAFSFVLKRADKVCWMWF